MSTFNTTIFVLLVFIAALAYVEQNFSMFLVRSIGVLLLRPLF